MNGEPLKSLWASGASALGAWCFFPGSPQAEAISTQGFDYVAIDTQHGLIDTTMALRMIQAIDVGGSLPIVRVPDTSGATIGRMLDYGALGIIAPMINNRQDVEDIVAACRYAPVGRRSYGPIRPSIRFGADYPERAADLIAVIPMIETLQALENLDEILSVDGVDAIYVGPSDLSLCLGLSPRNNDGVEAFDKALECILDRCRVHDVIPGIHADARTAADRLNQGFRMVTCALDSAALLGGTHAALRKSRPVQAET